MYNQFLRLERVLEEPGEQRYIEESDTFGCCYGSRGCAGIRRSIYGMGHTRRCLTLRKASAVTQVTSRLPFPGNWKMPALWLLSYYDMQNNVQPTRLQVRKLTIPWYRVSNEPTARRDTTMTKIQFACDAEIMIKKAQAPQATFFATIKEDIVVMSQGEMVLWSSNPPAYQVYIDANRNQETRPRPRPRPRPIPLPCVLGPRCPICIVEREEPVGGSGTPLNSPTPAQQQATATATGNPAEAPREAPKIETRAEESPQGVVAPPASPQSPDSPESDSDYSPTVPNDWEGSRFPAMYQRREVGRSRKIQ